MPDSPTATYNDRIEQFTQLHDDAHRRWSLLGNIRLIIAVAMIVCAWQMWTKSGTGWAIALVVTVIAFVVLAILQRRAGQVRNVAEAMATVNQRALDRLLLNWDELPLPAEPDADRTHPYAYDLNIVGWGSLAQRIGTPATRYGWTALYDALLNDSDPANIPTRQTAVSELASRLDLRQSVECAGLSDEPIPDSAPLLDWTREQPWVKPWLSAFAIVMPALLLLVIVLIALGTVHWSLILLPITLNTVTFFSIGAGAASRVQHIVPMRDAISTYQRIAARIAADTPRSPLLQGIDDQLGGAAEALAGLSSTVNFAMPPGSMLYFPLQMSVLWDIHVLRELERWRDQHGPHLDGWLRAIGEWESLAALSVLAHDHPDWATPVVDASLQGLTATQLAHPLLAADIAVANDVAITEPGHFLFVTGSNMSGKSTLLRAIGINVVLAQAGAPAYATHQQLPPLRVSSCMRVEDSLAHGVSFFMAELQRLKAVIDRVTDSDDRMSLYLLDEILQGTNTAERQIASRQVLRQLSRRHAIGAVSSHDLELIDDADLDAHAIAVHFAERFSREAGVPSMSFDYRLRDGIATSSNAIRLMELIGFDIEQD
ncbi:MAG: hypothetical protein M9950_05775 [Thermomicrobiales bacterium]|nr:hypothetical protein [Thermomicrobiales bacterium]